MASSPGFTLVILERILMLFDHAMYYTLDYCIFPEKQFLCIFLAKKHLVQHLTNPSLIRCQEQTFSLLPVKFLEEPEAQ